MRIAEWGTAAPGVVGIGDFGNFLGSQFAVDAVDQRAHFPSINEKRFTAPVAAFVILLVAGQKPEADGNLRGEKQLAGQRDHAIHEVGFNQGLANLAFIRGLRGH